jgi:hypothetical protein
MIDSAFVRQALRRELSAFNTHAGRSLIAQFIDPN